MSDKKDNKKNNLLEAKISNLDTLQAVFIMGVGAAKADGKVEDAEIEQLESISAMMGHEKEFVHAFAYFEQFEDSENAIQLAILALKKSAPSAKLAAILLMEAVLAEGGLNKAENDFYNKVVNQILD
jgi:4-aminobutyrate aminotransferase-like enzyme